MAERSSEKILEGTRDREWLYFLELRGKQLNSVYRVVPPIVQLFSCLIETSPGSVLYTVGTGIMQGTHNFSGKGGEYVPHISLPPATKPQGDRSHIYYNGTTRAVRFESWVAHYPIFNESNEGAVIACKRLEPIIISPKSKSLHDSWGWVRIWDKYFLADSLRGLAVRY